MKRVNVWLALVLICGLLATSLVGCGKFEESEQSLTKVRYCEVVRSIFYAPVYVAINEGFFADEGLEIELTTGQGADKVWRKADLLICPPATLLFTSAAIVIGSKVAIGAQDCHPAASGAHTGDLSAEMLADAGATAIIVGHSERRTDHHETDALVRAAAGARVVGGHKQPWDASCHCRLATVAFLTVQSGYIKLICNHSTSCVRSADQRLVNWACPYAPTPSATQSQRFTHMHVNQHPSIPPDRKLSMRAHIHTESMRQR